VSVVSSTGVTTVSSPVLGPPCDRCGPAALCTRHSPPWRCHQAASGPGTCSQDQGRGRPEQDCHDYSSHTAHYLHYTRAHCISLSTIADRYHRSADGRSVFTRPRHDGYRPSRTGVLSFGQNHARPTRPQMTLGIAMSVLGPQWPAGSLRSHLGHPRTGSDSLAENRLPAAGFSFEEIFSVGRGVSIAEIRQLPFLSLLGDFHRQAFLL
jgi:hypothetical protein